MMTSDGYFAAVAAMRCIYSPIVVVRKILDLQHHPPKYGRIPPRLLQFCFTCFNWLVSLVIVTYTSRGITAGV